MSAQQNETIIIPVLVSRFSVVVCWGSEKYVAKVAQKKGYSTTADTVKKAFVSSTAFTYREEGNHTPVIVLPKAPESPLDLNCLSHEAVHAVYTILNYIEQDIEGAEEVFAYMVGEVVETVTNHVQAKQWLKKRKKKK